MCVCVCFMCMCACVWKPEVNILCLFSHSYRKQSFHTVSLVMGSLSWSLGLS